MTPPTLSQGDSILHFLDIVHRLCTTLPEYWLYARPFMTTGTHPPIVHTHQPPFIEAHLTVSGKLIPFCIE